MNEYKYISNNQEDTKNLASFLINKLNPSDIVLLTGDLGAGKTTFVSGALATLGYKDHVVSPTFNILKCYFEVTPHIYHIDAYRLEGQNIDIGLEEYIEGDGICFIEWPVFVEPLIPSNHIEIKIKRLDDAKREITILSDGYDAIFEALRSF